MNSDIQKLSVSWKKGLLSGIDGDGDDGGKEHDDDDSGDDDGGDKSSKLELPKKKDHKYFKSALFVKNIQIKSRTLFQHDKRNHSWWGHA